MSSDSEQFVLSLNRFVKKAKDRADAAVRKIVLDLGTRIIMRSPVGDGAFWKSPPPPGYIGGHFRGNWQYGEEVRPTGTLATIDPSGGNTINSILRQLKAKGAAGKVHFLVNNLPYSIRLENGWSRQAPMGMVGVTVVEFRGIVRDAARSIR